MTLSPFREVAIYFLEMRKHHLSLTRNHLTKCPSFQASTRHSRELPQEPSAPSDCRTITFAVAANIREIKTPSPSTSPLAPEPVERVAARSAPAHKSHPDATLPPARTRHRPRHQRDL